MNSSPSVELPILCHDLTGTSSGPGANHSAVSAALVLRGGLLQAPMQVPRGLTCCILTLETLPGWGAAAGNPQRLRVQTLLGPVLERNHRRGGNSSLAHL